jgi:HD-GYP domain-containing protein (c-di-GMP phosphodiesterase class II)
MALASRTFLCSFVPLVALLLGSFWAVEKAVISAVRESFHASFHQQTMNLAASGAVKDQLPYLSAGIPLVLLKNGGVINSNSVRIAARDIEIALKDTSREHKCEIALQGRSYISIPVKATQLGDGYVLRTMQDLDAAIAPVASVVRDVLLTSGAMLLLAALIVAVLISRGIVKPIEEVVVQLREWERTSTIPKLTDDSRDTSIRKRFRADHIAEVRELIDSFSRAATVIRDGQESLHRAYVECVGSLASALDARDCYTAGHSHRVSEYSCAIAEGLGLDSTQQNELRIGALLHDIGKIGVPDSVLQNPGRLTGEDLRLIRQHPEIGRRILQGVNGFASYLSTVELHHENWDGTGYPHGLRGEATPLAARIVHVADAYDAMTSDRPYRSGMSSEDALGILEEHAGTQFDPVIVQVFAELVRAGSVRLEKDLYTNRSLRLLAESVHRESQPNHYVEAKTPVA